MLYVIGLGLSDEEDITVKGLAVRSLSSSLVLHLFHFHSVDKPIGRRSL